MRRDLAGDGRGAVYVEFLVCFLPVFVLFLGAVQLAFIASAKLVVRHAAVMGARSAIVVLEDDDPERYGNEAFGVVDYRGPDRSAGRNRADPMSRVAGWFGAEAGQLARFDRMSRGGPRLREIRKAVYTPLLAIAPPPEVIARWFGPGRGVAVSASGAGGGDAMDRAPWQRFAAGLLYSKGAAVVTFHREPGSPEIFAGAFGPRDDVTVRVTYLFHCAVPLASRFMCERPLGLSGVELGARQLRDVVADPSGIDPQQLAAMAGVARERVRRARRNLELYSRAESVPLTAALVLADARFAQLSAEATMPVQGADYYRERDDE